MMIENYKEKMADVIAMLDKQKEFREAEIMKGQRADKVEKQAKAMINQNELDEVFMAFMGKEYKDEQIGDLEGDDGVNPLTE